MLMRSQNVVQHCLSYLNGFNEIAASRNACECVEGLLKVVSYSLIFPPIIVGCLYLHHKKIVVLENTFDELMDQLDVYKTQEAFLKIYNINNKDVKQKDILQCLLLKVSNLNYEDLYTTEGKKEIERFQKGFKLLHLDKQHDLFVELMDRNLMTKLLDLDFIPKDIEELNFTMGESKFQDLDINDAFAMKFFNKLCEFKSLKKIRLDLKSLGFFGPAACQSLKNLTQDFKTDKIKNVYFPIRNNTMITRGTTKYYYTDRGSPISNAMLQLRKMIDRANEKGHYFEYHLDFMNLLIHGDNKGKIQSWENDEAFGKKQLFFVNKIVSFLHTKREKIPNM